MGRSRTQADRQFWWTGKNNIRTDNMFFYQLLDMAINVFEWKNLPDEIDPRFIELVLINTGRILFFKDEDMLNPDGEKGRYLMLRTAVGGTWSVYDVPNMRRAYASNGYQKELNEKNSVIMYNNYLRMPDIWVIQQFAQRLYECQRTIDVNVIAQKTPVLIVCTDENRLTMKNIWQKYDGNEPMMMVDKSIDLNAIKVLNMEAPYVASNLQNLKKEIFNECLTYLGIANIASVKKERLISDEVTRNLGGTEVEKHVRLNARKEACEKINKMFGLNIDVEYNSQIDIIVDATDAFDKTKDEQERGADYPSE